MVMVNKWCERIFFIVPILFICFIFLMSSDLDSDTRTLKFSEQIEKTVTKEIQNTTISSKTNAEQIDFIIRKSGHFIEYLALCILLLITCEASNIKIKTSAVYILFICLLIATLDEFYQSFIPSRNSSVRDSLIDFGGSLTGLIIYASVRKFMIKAGPVLKRKT